MSELVLDRSVCPLLWQPAWPLQVHALLLLTVCYVYVLANCSVCLIAFSVTRIASAHVTQTAGTTLVMWTYILLICCHTHLLKL